MRMHFAQQRPAHWTPLAKSARWLGWIEASSSGWSRNIQNIQVTMRLECISPPHPRHPGAKQHHTWTSRQPSVPSLPLSRAVTDASCRTVLSALFLGRGLDLLGTLGQSQDSRRLRGCWRTSRTRRTPRVARTIGQWRRARAARVGCLLTAQRARHVSSACRHGSFSCSPA